MAGATSKIQNQKSKIADPPIIPPRPLRLCDKKSTQLQLKLTLKLNLPLDT